MTSSSNITGSSRFDSVAAGWDAKPGRAVMAAAIAGAVADAVPLRPDMSALDFGAGTGLLTLALALRVKEVTALDASREMLRVLAEKTRAADIGNIATLHADIERDPLPAARFDLAAGAMVLHHLSDVPGALRRLHSSLRPGGWIALADLDSEDGSFHGDAQGVHHKGFDRARLRQWLEEAGFAWCSARTAYRLTRAGRDGVERSYPLFLAAARHLNREP